MDYSKSTDEVKEIVSNALDEVIDHADVLVDSGKFTRRSADHIIDIANRIKNEVQKLGEV